MMAGHFGLLGPISSGSLPVQIGCTEHMMTITWSDTKLFAEGVNPYEENLFGVTIETFGTLNLNISSRSYRRKLCMV